MRFKLYASPEGHAFAVSHDTDATGQWFSFESNVRDGAPRHQSNKFRANDGRVEMDALGYQLAGDIDIAEITDLRDRKTAFDKFCTFMILIDIYVKSPPTQPTNDGINEVLVNAARIMRAPAGELLDIPLFTLPQPASRYQWESFR